MPTNSREYMRKYYLKNKDKLKKASAQWRKKNPQKVKEIVKRSNANPKTKAKKEKWAKDNQNKMRVSVRKYAKRNPGIRRKNQKRYAKLYPTKIEAQKMAQKVKLNSCCEICKDRRGLEKHHWRYDKPLLVSTLCKECHTIQHKKNRRKRK